MKTEINKKNKVEDNALQNIKYYDKSTDTLDISKIIAGQESTSPHLQRLYQYPMGE